MMQHFRGCYLAFVLLAVTLGGAASAQTVNISPDQISGGGPVSITVSGLADNMTFSLAIEGTFPVSPGAEFSFIMRDLVLPFTLEEGTMTATLSNTQSNLLEVQKGETTVRKVGASKNGTFTTENQGTLPSGTYDTITIGGTALPGASLVGASVRMHGRKVGPNDAVITFSPGGVNSGTVDVSVAIGDQTVLQRVYQLGVSVTPSGGSGGGVSYSDGGSNGGGGSGGGSSGGVSIVASPVTRPVNLENGTSTVVTTKNESPTASPVSSPQTELTRPATTQERPAQGTTPGEQSTSPPPTRAGMLPGVLLAALVTLTLVMARKRS